MTNSGADGLKGSWRPIQYCQSRANLVLWVPFLQKQPPTDGRALQNVHLLTKRPTVPAATLCVLSWWAEQARSNRSQTRICNGPLKRVARDMAQSLSNATWIEAFIHRAPASWGRPQITPKQGSKDRKRPLSLPLHIHSHFQ